MSFRAYVGNIPYSYTAQDLQRLFSDYGSVRGAEVISDRVTGRSRGFGFVEMETAEALKSAMDQLNGKDIQGRALTVNEARERTARPSGPRPGGGSFGAPRPQRPGGFQPRDPGAGAGAGSGSGGGAGRPSWERRGDKRFEDGGSGAAKRRRDFEEKPRGGRWGGGSEEQ